MDDAKIDKIIKEHRGDASSIIQLLLDIQRENHWVSKEVLEKVCEKLNVPMSQVQHIATFFKSLDVNPEARHTIHVCDGTGCHVRGATRLVDKVEDIIGVKAGETDPDLKFSLKTVVCMGKCASGPVMVVDGMQHSKITPAKAEEVLKGYK